MFSYLTHLILLVCVCIHILYIFFNLFNQFWVLKWCLHRWCSLISLHILFDCSFLTLLSVAAISPPVTHPIIFADIERFFGFNCFTLKSMHCKPSCMPLILFLLMANRRHQRLVFLQDYATASTNMSTVTCSCLIYFCTTAFLRGREQISPLYRMCNYSWQISFSSPHWKVTSISHQSVWSVCRGAATWQPVVSADHVQWQQFHWSESTWCMKRLRAALPTNRGGTGSHMIQMHEEISSMGGGFWQ